MRDVWLGLIVCLSIVLAASAADACSCAPPSAGIGVGPATGTLVPTDTKIWLERFDDVEPTLELYAPASNSVIALNRVGDSQRWWGIKLYHPARELDPDTVYEVLFEFDREQEERSPLTSFTTGSGPSQSAPPVPTITGLSSTAGADSVPGAGFLFGNSCSPINGTYLGQVDYASESFVDVLSVLDDPAEPTDITDSVIGAASNTGVFVIGRGGCTYLGDNAGPFGRETVRIGSFDVSGNFSGWSQPQTLSYPAPGCSCSASEQAGQTAWASGFLALAAVGGALRRRRQDRRST